MKHDIDMIHVDVSHYGALLYCLSNFLNYVTNTAGKNKLLPKDRSSNFVAIAYYNIIILNVTFTQTTDTLTFSPTKSLMMHEFHNLCMMLYFPSPLFFDTDLLNKIII